MKEKRPFVLVKKGSSTHSRSASGRPVLSLNKTKEAAAKAHTTATAAVEEAVAKSGPGAASGVEARHVALALIEAVLDKKHFLDDAITANPTWASLRERDRAFARLLAATTLRRLGECDRWLESALTKPLPENAYLVWYILRLAIVQLAFLGTPVHAVASTAVNLTKAVGFFPFGGLVNALVRRFGTDGIPAFAQQKDQAGRMNTPLWLWNSWVGTYGEAKALAIATAHMSEAPTDLSLKDPKSADHWAKKLGGLILPNGSVRVRSAGRITELSGYGDGAWWVQDMAATLPMRLLGPVHGKEVLDIGAAPGGKTAQLAAAGAHVTALDRSESRLVRLKENMARLSLNATVVTTDILVWNTEQQFDAIILDAPCSATGTIRRHPELVHLKHESEISGLVSLQQRMLARAAALLRPGGVLVYCVCSLQPQEAEEVIEQYLAREGALVQRDPDAGAFMKNALPKMEHLITEAGDLRSTPADFATEGGMDGFYACRLIRPEA